MRKRTHRLTLHRETLLRLDDAPLRRVAAGTAESLRETEESACISPRCGPSFWETC
jgi:hypothetical protein